MYFKIKNNPYAVIVLSEIYGITSSVRLSCDMFHSAGFDVIAPDYFHLPRTYSAAEQDPAYRAFTAFGFDRAAEEVRNLAAKIRPHYEKVFITGFSAGATTAWICASDRSHCDGITAIYGSRIRNYTSLKPEVPSLVIFPDSEASFCVRDLSRSLSSALVTTRIYEGKHGFADPRSELYNENSSHKAHHEAVEFFRKYS